MELPSWKELMLTVLILAAATGIGEIFFRLGFTDANIITVYLFGVMLTSILPSGYTCSVVSSVASVVLFNYFMTEPRLSLYAYGSGYPVTFAIMLGTSILPSTLASKLKENAKLSARDAFRTKILFNTSQLLQKAEDASEIFDITATQLIKLLGRNLVVAPVEKKKNGIVQGTLYNAETGIKSEKVFNEKEQEIRMYAQLNFLALICCVFFSFLPVVTRIVYYFSVNQILMLPMVTAGIADETARKKVKYLIIAFCALYFLVFLMMAGQPGVRLLPYRSWLFESERFLYK